MAKKRKAGGRPAKQNSAQESERTKFAFEERFDDSGDEFQAGRDQILLEEAPEAKRRRKMAEQGLSGQLKLAFVLLVPDFVSYRGIASAIRRGDHGLRVCGRRRARRRGRLR
jgi:hypothetical protein